MAPLSEKAHADAPWQNLCQPVQTLMDCGKLTAAWWQWLYSIPASNSPALDPDGTYADTDQPYSDLLFLAGTYQFAYPVNPSGAVDVVGIVTRSIKVNEGTALFFPLVDYEADNNCLRPSLGGNCGGPNGTPTSPFPANMDVAQLQQVAAANMNCATVTATLTPMYAGFVQPTGDPPVPVAIARLQWPGFSYKLPPGDNLIQATQGLPISGGTVAPVASDGYFSLVPAGQLKQGYYLLHYEGSVPLVPPVPPTDCSAATGGNFIQNITYHITVTS